MANCVNLKNHFVLNEIRFFNNIHVVHVTIYVPI